MKRLLLILGFVICVAGSVRANSDDPFIKKCRESFHRDFPNTTVNDFERSPIDGLCEVHAGLNVFYYKPGDGGARGLLFIGSIYTPTGKDLTGKVREKLLRQAIAKLDLSHAIKIGHGPVKIIEITDPDCPYCRRLEALFHKDPGIESKVTRYVYLYPLRGLHPHSEAKARWVLCQADPAGALEKVMIDRALDGKEITYPATCKLATVEKALEAAKSTAKLLGVRGTPYVIVEGRVIRGFRPRLIQRLIEEAGRRSSQQNKS